MRPTVFDIRCSVADFYGVHPDVLELSSKRAEYIRPRHVAIWLTRKMTELGWVEIGKRFGGRDSTTIHYSFKKVDERLAEDEELIADLAQLALMLGDEPLSRRLSSSNLREAS